MPFNGVLLVSAAKKSADLWQQAACLPERISSDEMLDLALCFPLQQLGRWALYIWTYLCVSPYPHSQNYAVSYYGDDSDDDYGGDSEGGSDGDGGDSSSSSSGINEFQYYCYSNQSNRGYDSSTHSD